MYNLIFFFYFAFFSIFAFEIPLKASVVSSKNRVL